MLLLNVAIKVFITDLIPLFILPIVRQILLDCVVRQVDAAMAVLQRVLARSGSDVAIFVPIAFNDAIYARHHDVMPQIELPSAVEERAFDVSLHDVGSIGAILIDLSLLQCRFDFL